MILMKPIVYGNVSRYFGKKREEDGHTHAWTCYLRPFKNEVCLYIFLFYRTELSCVLPQCVSGYFCILPSDISCILPQDMSVYVKKVQFKLHESYPNHIRGGFLIMWHCSWSCDTAADHVTLQLIMVTIADHMWHYRWSCTTYCSWSKLGPRL